MMYSPALEAALRDVVPSTDPLDAPDFNPISHINKLFPNEESLSSADTVSSELQEKMTALEEEILQTVRQQTTAGSHARKDLESGKAAMRDLFEKVHDIKAKAERSQQMVHEICRDIKSLDYAKRHLTQTITALKRLQMLVTATEQLSVMARERMYAEAANLLHAVTQLLAHFQGYAGIKKVDALREQVGEIRDALRTQVFEDFNRLSAQEGNPHPSQIETLLGACAVVDALGADVRREMIAWFCNWQFAPYKHAFQPYGDAGSLDKTELRYGWHRQLLRQYDESFVSLFPAAWRVALVVTIEFSAISHKHLEEILDQSRGSLDVAVLTHALQKTVEFEKEMHARFTAESVEPPPGPADGAASPAGAGARKPPDPEALLGSISACFDSYMSIYVSLEDKNIGEAVGKLLVDETWAAASTGRPDSRVFNSSKELFIALKRSFKRGTALQMDNVLFELYKVWAKHLRAYAKKVQEQLHAVGQPTEVSITPSCHLDLPQQQMVCAAVNTCKYCHETTGQLGESISKAMGSEHASKVDMGAVQDEFQSVVTSGIKLLVSALETRLTPALVAMTKIKWDVMEEMGEDTSPYMSEVAAKVREMMPQLGESLLPLYVKFFCDKFVQSFVPRLIGYIYRCKRIGEVGAQQMQADLGTLKATLLELPALGQSSASAMYAKLVAKEVAAAEHVLKLVLTPEELLEETVAEMDRTGVKIDLGKILELKGLKKADTERIVEAYNMMHTSASEGGKKIKKLFNLGT